MHSLHIVRSLKMCEGCYFFTEVYMKSKLKALKCYFTPFELILFLLSAAVMTAAFVIFKGADALSYTASLIGAASLLLSAKGNPLGQALIIVFSVIYSYISFSRRYYGEMLTYAGMTAPMAAASLCVWLKNPFGSSHSQVRVRSAEKKELALIALLTVPVTILFYFLLRFLGTASIIPSTLSTATSFLAVSLTLRRCALYALAYAANDLVLIALWLPACFDNTSYVPVLTCFAVFLVHDIYGFFNWNRLRKLQSANAP